MDGRLLRPSSCLITAFTGKARGKDLGHRRHRVRRLHRRCHPTFRGLPVEESSGPHVSDSPSPSN
jgi:hypothetical protein